MGSAAQSISKTISELRDAKTKRDRPVVVKAPAKKGEGTKFDTIDPAIEYVERQCPHRVEAAEKVKAAEAALKEAKDAAGEAQAKADEFAAAFANMCNINA